MLAHGPTLHSARVAPASGWRLNYAALLLAQLVSSATFASINPFLPLYLLELGETQASVILWVGLISAGSNILQLFANPFWGAIADRFGRKAMVVRSLFGVAVVMGVLVFAQTAWQVFLIRAVQGAVAAPNPALLGLASTVLPAARLGAGLGVLQTVQFVGSSTGPLLGGLAAAAFGYRGAFLIAGGMAFVNAIVVILLVREPRRSKPGDSRVIGIAERLTLGLRVPGWRAAILATLGYQAAYSVGYVLLPLQIVAISGADNDAAAVGWVVAANAAGVASGAAVLGWLTTRVGSRRMAVLALLVAGLLTIPLGVAMSTAAFAVLRFALGFCIGGVLPSLRTVIAQAARTPDEEANLGAVYGLSFSAVSAGGVIAAPLASFVAAFLGFPAVDVVSGTLLIGTAAWYAIKIRHLADAGA